MARALHRDPAAVARRALGAAVLVAGVAAFVWLVMDAMARAT
jgi:ferric-dicitrate binding protein FerR (iron transport regulator)